MQGAPRRQARSSARFFFLLPSVLALLALALFPVAAHAECSTSSCLNYEVEVPSIESEGPTKSSSGKSPTHHKAKNNAKAEGSAAEENSSGGVGTEEPGSEGESSEGGHHKKGSSSKEEEGKSSMGGGGNGGNKPNGGANSGGSEGSISEGKDLGNTQQGKNVAESSGGSSPVVPILIAVVVLAAISIGVVLYRQRKSDQDGSDGRASSPSAS
jgi:cobalamin biosynthesis Mg chelatase CobN